MSNIKNIKEEVTISDVDKQIKNYIDTKTFESKIDKIIKEKLKDYPELENKMVEISKNVLTQLYKTLWVKKDFWRNNLTNKSS